MHIGYQLGLGPLTLSRVSMTTRQLHSSAFVKTSV